METTITVLQAIAIKQCSVSTIYRWIKQGRINAMKQSGRWNIVCDEKWQTIQKRQLRRAVIVSFGQQLAQQVRKLRQENEYLKTQQLEALRKHQEEYDIYERDIIEISDMHRQEIENYEQKLLYLENTVQKQEVMIRDKDTIIKKLYHANMGLGKPYKKPFPKLNIVESITQSN